MTLLPALQFLQSLTAALQREQRWSCRSRRRQLLFSRRNHRAKRPQHVSSFWFCHRRSRCSPRAGWFQFSAPFSWGRHWDGSRVCPRFWPPRCVPPCCGKLGPSPRAVRRALNHRTTREVPASLIIDRWEVIAHYDFLFKNFYWSIVDLQCCISFRCTAKCMLCISIYPF